MSEKNLGTIMYPCPNYPIGDSIYTPNEHTLIEWKQNMAFIFSRIYGKTWHPYKSDGENNRLAFVMNISTKRIKEVDEIENSNEFKKL